MQTQNNNQNNILINNIEENFIEKFNMDLKNDRKNSDCTFISSDKEGKIEGILGKR
jgi:hypothetical protein